MYNMLYGVSVYIFMIIILTGPIILRSMGMLDVSWLLVLWPIWITMIILYLLCYRIIYDIASMKIKPYRWYKLKNKFILWLLWPITTPLIVIWFILIDRDQVLWYNWEVKLVWLVYLQTSIIVALHRITLVDLWSILYGQVMVIMD